VPEEIYYTKARGKDEEDNPAEVLGHKDTKNTI